MNEDLNITEYRNENTPHLTVEEEELLARIMEEEHQEIPLNSESLLIDEATSRFSSAVWYKVIQEKTIILAGVGGIGSFVAFLLARVNPKSLYIYDSDIVEFANMSGQLYGKKDIGKLKVDAISGMISEYCDNNSTFAIHDRFDESSEANNIMICGFDNMHARKVFFNKWKSYVYHLPRTGRENCLFIDGRLAAEEFQVFCIRGDDDYNISKYENKFLFSDAEAEETICSYKQTTFMANMIASVMINLFVNFCANQSNPIISRDLPFYTRYSAETMYFKTEA